MIQVGTRALRNETRQLLERVEAGETIEITVAGRAVARLVPVDRRPRFMPRDQFLALLEGNQADPGLTEELRRLAPDTTDDIPIR
ncbi:MAG TPA: type II toxin-antitoxin system prevent-host-death family antitoxin [Candidatus Limnocylindrales bacterium]|nr:type II toxin-antitoxin system prevent-host-death family antitoxin [Candidatus Limnocylindrales bacterium]